MHSCNVSIILAASVHLHFWPSVAPFMRPRRGGNMHFLLCYHVSAFSTTTGFGWHVNSSADTGSMLMLMHKRSRLIMQLLNRLPDAMQPYRHTHKRSRNLRGALFSSLIGALLYESRHDGYWAERSLRFPSGRSCDPSLAERVKPNKNLPNLYLSLYFLVLGVNRIWQEFIDWLICQDTVVEWDITVMALAAWYSQ